VAKDLQNSRFANMVLCVPPPQGMDDHAENLKKVLKDPICCGYQIAFKLIVY
jgi:hypothetical protein